MALKFLGILAACVAVLLAEVLTALLGFLQIRLTTGDGGVTIETVIAVVGAIVGIATAYLRLYMSSSLSKFKEEILQAIRVEFVNKEIHATKFDDLNRRVDKLEKRDG